MRFYSIGLATLATLVIVGCGGNQQSTDMNTPMQPGGSGRGTAAAPKVGRHLEIGVVFDSAGKGDKALNDGSERGTQLADKDLDINVHAVESSSPKDYEKNLTGLAETGCDLVFVVGASQQKALEAVAPKYPKVKFAIIDAVVDKPNVRSLVFAEEQGSFLAGIVAGSTSKTGKIGFVGSKDSPATQASEAGYEAGAKTANPKIEILPAKFTDTLDDIDKGKAAADALFSAGVDIVYHAAGRSGLGVINSAKEHKLFAIGDDSDQDDVAKGRVLTSMIKRVDQAVYLTIKDTATDKFTPGTKLYDLKADGVGLSEMKFTKNIVGKATLAKVAKMADAIKKGTLKVPSTSEQLTAYLATLSATPAAPAKKK